VQAVYLKSENGLQVDTSVLRDFVRELRKVADELDDASKRYAKSGTDLNLTELTPEEVANALDLRPPVGAFAAALTARMTEANSDLQQLIRELRNLASLAEKSERGFSKASRADRDDADSLRGKLPPDKDDSREGRG